MSEIKICDRYDDREGKNNFKHGESFTRLYRTWAGMKARCNNKFSSNFKYYGGRGIFVCQEWEADFTNFRNWALSHGYTDTLTIDRIKNDGNYEPSNCQWLTKSENTRKANLDRKKKTSYTRQSDSTEVFGV